MNPICQYNRCPRLSSLADGSSANRGVSTGSVHFHAFPFSGDTECAQAGKPRACIRVGKRGYYASSKPIQQSQPLRRSSPECGDSRERPAIFFPPVYPQPGALFVVWQGKPGKEKSTVSNVNQPSFINAQLAVLPSPLSVLSLGHSETPRSSGSTPTITSMKSSGSALNRRCRCCGAEFPVDQENPRKPHTCKECEEQSLYGRHNPRNPGIAPAMMMGVGL
jgi:hypothetical protein